MHRDSINEFGLNNYTRPIQFSVVNGVDVKNVSL